MKKPSGNIWQRLPAELKNIIYKLVLSEENTVLIGNRYRLSQFRLAQYGAAEKAITRWKEPALFSICKAIRTEAVSMYYQLNAIHLVILLKDVDTVFTWLAKIPWARGDFLSARNLTISICGIGRSNIPSWTAIAMQIFGHHNPTSARSEESEVDAWTSLFPVRSNAYTLISPSPFFKEMVQISVKSRRQGMGLETFKKDLKDWAVRCMKPLCPPTLCCSRQPVHEDWHRRVMMRLNAKLGPPAPDVGETDKGS